MQINTYLNRVNFTSLSYSKYRKMTNMYATDGTHHIALKL